MIIAVDDMSSWPPDLLAVLQHGLLTLRSYNDRQMEVDRIWETRHRNVEVRHNPPQNSFRGARETILDRVREKLAGIEIIGWHCTRLCDDEIAAVLASGMYPLSPDSFRARLQRRLDVGDITPLAFEALNARNQAHADSRGEQLWFVFTRSTLADDGVRDFFANWGGEALYTSHDRDPVTGPILRSLGRPCIVEVRMPRGSIPYSGHPIEDTVVRIFQISQGIVDVERAESEGYTRQAIGPEQVRRVIKADDPEFETLTGEQAT